MWRSFTESVSVFIHPLHVILSRGGAYCPASGRPSGSVAAVLRPLQEDLPGLGTGRPHHSTLHVRVQLCYLSGYCTPTLLGVDHDQLLTVINISSPGYKAMAYLVTLALPS